MKIIYALLLLTSGLSAQTQVDWVNQLKNKPFLDIRSYGARCDGTTNDQAAFVAAITAAGASVTGAVILLPSGICTMSAPIIITRDNVTFVGQGGWSDSGLCHQESGGPNCIGNSVIKAIGTWTDGTYMLTWDGSTQTRKYLLNGGLRYIDMDANNKASGQVHLVQVSGTDFFKTHLHNHTNATGVTYGFYFESTNTSTATTGSTCGNNGGFVHVMDMNIQSYRTGAAGMQIGTPGTTYDVCSNRFVNLTIEILNRPGSLGLWLSNTDSNEFTNVFVEGNNDGKAITSILSTGATTATVTIPSHGLPSGSTNVGVVIVNACSTALVSDVCGGTEIRGLEGPFAATYVDANTLTITGAFGLTGATTYYAQTMFAVDVSFGGCGNCGGNLFSTLCGSLFQEPTGGSGYGNNISNWNWITDGNGANPAYQRIGGNWVGHINAYGISNFQSVPSIHGGITHTSGGQVLVNFQDTTATAANQQAMRLLYDGGANITGGGLGIQSLTDALGFQANLFVLFKSGIFQLQQEIAFGSLPAAANCSGCLARVNDSNTTTWGANVAAGGGNHILAYSNGTAWTVLGK